MDLFAFDDDYVRRLRLHDRDTVEHFERYFRELFKVKYSKKLWAIEDLEDVLQTTLQRVFKKLDELQDSHKLGAFVNTFSDHVYSEKVREDLKGKRGDAILPRPPPTSILDDLIDEEDRQQIRRAVDAMDPPEREIIYAIFLNEEDKDAICARLGISRKYLRVLQFRALEKLREKFRDKSL